MQHIKFYSNYLPGTFDLNGKTYRPGVLAQRMADYVDVYIVTRDGEYSRFRLETQGLPAQDMDPLAYICQCSFYLECLTRAYGTAASNMLNILADWLTCGQCDSQELLD